MSGRWLFRVFDAFNVRGRGWVLVPGVPRDNPGVAVGDRVELRGGKGPPRPGRCARSASSPRRAATRR
jgi:hypothetical protein